MNINMLNLGMLKLNMSIIANTNHKLLGLYYILLSFLFSISGTLFSLIVRFELLSSGNKYICSENYNIYNLSFTLHGLIMIFFLLMPSLYGGFGNYLLPISTLSPEVNFPRINNIALLLLLVSYLCIVICLLSDYGSPVGWTLYPPLSTNMMNLNPLSLNYIVYGLLISGISSLLSSINFLITVLNSLINRLLGMSSLYISLFVYSIIFTAIMLVLTLPILTGALIMLLFDLNYNVIFFDPIYSGDPIFFQHLFWYFGHPEVYILIVPGFGVISLSINLFSLKNIFGSQSMVLALGCISIIGTVVWGHHMAVVGMEYDTRAYFTAVTILISLPTSTKIFNWACSLLGIYKNLFILICPGLIYSFMFILYFSLGGSTGVILSSAIIDIALHDTYYVVAHFHMVLSLGAIISLLCIMVTTINMLFGSSNDIIIDNNSFYMYYHYILLILGISTTFLPLHFLGFNVMPRRIPDFPDHLLSWNVLSSLGSTITILALSLLIKMRPTSL